jgi:hypothetical protein
MAVLRISTSIMDVVPIVTMIVVMVRGKR